MLARTRVTQNRLPQIARALPGAVSGTLVRGTRATHARGRARSPVATGELRDSHGIEGDRPGSLAMRVVVTAGHGEPVHEGTRRVPPRPWLREAARETFPATIAELRRLERVL